jgi:phosphoglycerate dehydrogenase-like enzyme
MRAQGPCVVAVLGSAATAPPPGLDGPLPGCDLRFITSPESLAASAADTEVVFAWDPVPGWLPGCWQLLGRLRWIAAATAGVDWLLFPELAASDVVVTNSAGVFDDAMAEYALALVSAVCVDLPTTIRLQAAREWRHRETARLAGRPVLVAGAGGIGRAITRLLRGAGMTVRCVARTRRADPGLGEVAALADLPGLLPGADFVILALPLTPATRGLFGEALLGRMRPDAWLVNLGRGGLVDEPALVAALRAGTIGGAALDVVSEEPLPAASPLWELPNVIVSPHMSGDFRGFEQALADLFRGQLRRYLAGEPLVNVVSKQLGFVPSR